MASMPALCPIARGRNRCRAHRLFPSMMMATCSGGGSWAIRGSGRDPPLDLHDLAFLAGSEFVDAPDVAVGKLLRLLERAAAVVGRCSLLLLTRLGGGG